MSGDLSPDTKDCTKLVVVERYEAWIIGRQEVTGKIISFVAGR